MVAHFQRLGASVYLLPMSGKNSSSSSDVVAIEGGGGGHGRLLFLLCSIGETLLMLEVSQKCNRRRLVCLCVVFADIVEKVL